MAVLQRMLARSLRASALRLTETKEAALLGGLLPRVNLQPCRFPGAGRKSVEPA